MILYYALLISPVLFGVVRKEPKKKSKFARQSALVAPFVLFRVGLSPASPALDFARQTDIQYCLKDT